MTANVNLPHNEFYFLDLFAGCGGMSAGLESVGFNSIGAIEINPVPQETLNMNFGETRFSAIRAAKGDVTKVDVQSLKREMRSYGIHELGLLVACPPCQGFSRIGRGKLDSLAGVKGGHLKDPRNKLYKKVVEYVAILKPRAFLFENVPGILSIGGKNVAEMVCKDIEACGYTVKAALLNAAWYGVPQLRERLIIMAFRKDLRTIPTFPKIKFNGSEVQNHMCTSEAVIDSWSNKNFFVPYSSLGRSRTTPAFVSVYEAINDLPVFQKHLHCLKRKIPYKSLRTNHEALRYKSGSSSRYAKLMRNWPDMKCPEFVSDHFCRWTPRDFQLFKRMKEGDKYPEAVEIAKKLYKKIKDSGKKVSKAEIIPPYATNSFEDKWHKLIRSRPSWTLTAHIGKDTYSHIHYDSNQARSITIREAARLQSFPDSFKFFGNTGTVFTQIGNAVPPLLAQALGSEIKKHLLSTPARSSSKKMETNLARP